MNFDEMQIIFNAITESSGRAPWWEQGVVTPICVVTGSRGHSVVTGLRRFFSTVACCHGAVLCRAESHVHRMVPQVPSSSAAHALSESILGSPT